MYWDNLYESTSNLTYKFLLTRLLKKLIKIFTLYDSYLIIDTKKKKVDILVGSIWFLNYKNKNYILLNKYIFKKKKKNRLYKVNLYRVAKLLIW